MNVIPAIDLMNGSVVRLVRGDARTVKTYLQFGTPIQVAEKWEREGANSIHVIDLDAAKSRGDNRKVVARIVESAGIPVQLGGGIRTRKRAEELFSLGVARLIIGTMAFERPLDLSSLITRYGTDRVLVALDYLNDQVMMRGWDAATRFKVDDALKKFIDLGVENFLLTSISQDGLLTGPDCTTLKRVSRLSGAKVYAAGGVSSLKDLIRLMAVGVSGVVVGKALYEGKFTLKEAIQITKKAEEGVEGL